MRDQDGDLPAVDEAAVEIAARALKRYRSVSTYCDLHGYLDEKGNLSAAAGYVLPVEAALTRALDNLGMTPASRARLGVDLARSGSLPDQAAAMQAGGDRLRARAAAIDATVTAELPLADPARLA